VYILWYIATCIDLARLKPKSCGHE